MFKDMKLVVTANHSTGETRYFVDGKRVTRWVMDGIKRDHELDAFRCHNSRTHHRSSCYARREKP